MDFPSNPSGGKFRLKVSGLANTQAYLNGLEGMRQLQRLSKFPLKLFTAFWLEGAETTKMVHTFVRQGRAKVLLKSNAPRPTEAEMAAAVAQLKDLPRFIPFFVVVIMPLPGVTEGYALVAVTLEKWLGNKVRLLPSEFRKIFLPETRESVN